MGLNKAGIPKNKMSLGFYLATLMEEVTGQKPVLLGRGTIGPETEQYTILEDPKPDRGPLGGLMAYILAYPQQNLLLLPSDLFAMDLKALRWLCSCVPDKTDDKVIWPAYPHRDFGEPLSGIYLKSSFPLLIKAWESGNLGPARAVPKPFRSEPVIPEEHHLAFSNVNTPAELDTIRNRIHHKTK
jgi:molybdopterin-guanine dinucleotide biosynthesis protein A